MPPLLTLHLVRHPRRHPPGLLLEGQDWSVAAASRTAIVGAEGSGKGELLRLLAGLTPPAAGAVLWDGLAERPAGLVGLVLADASRTFLAALVGEEIALAPLAQGLRDAALAERVERAMHWAGVAPAWGPLPLARLTPSQGCRVALAAVLAGAPRLLLLEEPGALLSQEGEEALAATLTDLAARHGVASIIFTTRLSRARLFAEAGWRLAAGRLQPLSLSGEPLPDPVERAPT